MEGLVRYGFEIDLYGNRIRLVLLCCWGIHVFLRLPNAQGVELYKDRSRSEALSFQTSVLHEARDELQVPARR
jgi:hypothetical protein